MVPRNDSVNGMFALSAAFPQLQPPLSPPPPWGGTPVSGCLLLGGLGPGGLHPRGLAALLGFTGSLVCILPLAAKRWFLDVGALPVGCSCPLEPFRCFDIHRCHRFEQTAFRAQR